MNKFLNIMKWIVIVLAIIELFDLVSSITGALKAYAAKSKAKAAKEVIKAHTILVRETWKNTLEKIGIICDSYTSDKRYDGMDRQVMFDNAKEMIMKSIPKEDMDNLSKEFSPEMDYILSTLILTALDKEKMRSAMQASMPFPMDLGYYLDDDDEDDEDDDDD